MAKKTMILHYLIHTSAYYIAWFAGIALAAYGYAGLSFFVIIAFAGLQFYWQYRMLSVKGLGILLALLILMSTVVDSILVYQGIIVYSANPFSPYFTAPWMISLWVSFTITLYATLSRLFEHLFLLGILSSIGFAFAFRIGAKLGAVIFPYGANKTSLLMGIIWSILLPFCVYCYLKIRDY